MFWAHSDPKGLRESDKNAQFQPLAKHLRQVGHLAEQLAKAAQPEDPLFHRMAWATGMLHDVGKYSPDFQRLIRGELQKAPHAAYGAALALHHRSCGESAFAIVGHHSGIPNRLDGTGSLIVRAKDALENANALWPDALKDCPELAEALESLPPSIAGEFDLRTRMLFSCLIDADRLDTASRALSVETLRPHERLAALIRYIEKRAANVDDGIVKTVRALILQDCLSAGDLPQRLLSMTVPTGGGKTLASLALALRIAVQRPAEVRRIIVVVPYLSIIEQNAQVFANALGADAILEHHSGNFERLKIERDKFVPAEDDIDNRYDRPWARPATENWDAPIVVTTSVRFFESLFSNRPSDLRRVHNIARSVVILDEVQTLPRQFLTPLLSVISSLANNWSTTFVFCTATQPAFERSPHSGQSDPRWPIGTVREVIRDVPEHYRKLRRVAVRWNLQEPLPWDKLAREMLAGKQALAVVNLRDHAAELYKALKKQTGDPAGLFHLSTRMCAAHRLSKLDQIRSTLKKVEPCIVASTQLVEAGVDLDFPRVFRSLAPFDSIVQAAGRCDREGVLTARLARPGGTLTVFRTEDGMTPPHEYREATNITSNMARGQSLSIDDPAVMRRYFDRYYGDADRASLGHDLEFARDARQARFLDVANEFRMITDYLQDVFVPWDEKSRALIEQLDQWGALTRELRRGLQRYIVGLSPKEFLTAKRGAIRQIGDTDLWVCVEGMYHDDLGLLIQPDPASLVV